MARKRRRKGRAKHRRTRRHRNPVMTANPRRRHRRGRAKSSRRGRRSNPRSRFSFGGFLNPITENMPVIFGVVTGFSANKIAEKKIAFLANAKASGSLVTLYLTELVGDLFLGMLAGMVSKKFGAGVVIGGFSEVAISALTPMTTGTVYDISDYGYNGLSTNPAKVFIEGLTMEDPFNTNLPAMAGMDEPRYASRFTGRD